MKHWLNRDTILISKTPKYRLLHIYKYVKGR
nr:MAG TPA: hypothetical protein [Caudoviricetes sp.]